VQKIKAKGQSVRKIEWKRADGQMEGRTDERRRLHYPLAKFNVIHAGISEY